MKKYYFILIFVFSYFLPIYAINTSITENSCPEDSSYLLEEKSLPVTINCIQTNAAGDVTINWSQAVDPTSSFVEYQVHSVQNGLLATISTISTTAYTDLGVTQKNDYYITVVGDTQENSDTLSNIFLTLNNPSDGTAVLQWNDPISLPLPSMNGYYKIYREYPVGNWLLRDSVQYGTHLYKDTIDICQAFLSYQIILPNQPCIYTSNIVGDDFSDILTPDIPVITEVTIDTLNNDVTINWNQNPQSDTYGYIIYLIDGNGFPTEIDTVWGVTNTTYSYSTDLTAGPLSYSIAAFDSCQTDAVPVTYQTSAKAEIHTSIYLRNTLSICDNGIRLYWTSYSGWNNLSTYQVWGHIVGQPWVNFGSTNNLNFNITGEPLQDYCFAIKAVSADGKESFSNTLCFNVVAPTPPSFNYLQVATVVGNQIELRHFIDQSAGVTAIAFERMNKIGVFEEIGQVPVTSQNISFTDTDVMIEKFSYTYRAIVIDSCGNHGDTSNIAKTILLTAISDDLNMVHHLNWTKYEEFNAAILGYSVFRGYDGIYNPTPLAFLPNTQFSYDDTSTNTPASGKTCFLIEAVEGTNFYGFHEVSRSNEVCPIINPIIFIPNSFTPDGDNFNEVFYPVVTYYDYHSYDLTIFDRWEHPIFQSNDSDQGWNGEINSTGKFANPGTYFYLFRILDGEGKEVIRRGHVNLIR